MRRATAVILIVLCAGPLAACGDDPGEETTSTLRVYVSAPMKGGRGGEDTASAVKIAVENAGGTVDSAAIDVVALNDSAPDGAFDPKLVRDNALRAARDDRAIAYIGEFDSGGTELAMPILNRAGILHVSSGSTALKLTKPSPAEGERLRPTGVTTFGRVVPNDMVQAGALEEFMHQESVATAYVVDDGGTYGVGLRRLFEKAATATGIKVIEGPRVSARTEFGNLAEKISRADPNALLYAGSDLELAFSLFESVHRTNGHIKLFGGDGLALSGFLTTLGPIELDTYVTAPQLPAGNYARSGEDFLDGFRDEFGRDAEPMSVFGYEAGAAVMDSIRRGVRGDISTDAISTLRTGTREAFFDITERASPLGSYSIDVNGDTTLPFYGAYRVENGELVLGRTIDVPVSILQELDQ
ncbi:MAG TPA: branched-chain amino acid ABC transporter substrate-binding protein [Solirubrobacterales bacterium]|nr:branched-chain amino acid ABC transporter substrate-binding protein [Solirubrobacterales bacterium]